MLENSQKSLNLIDKACKILGIVLSQTNEKKSKKQIASFLAKFAFAKTKNSTSSHHLRKLKWIKNSKKNAEF